MWETAQSRIVILGKSATDSSNVRSVGELCYLTCGYIAHTAESLDISSAQSIIILVLWVHKTLRAIYFCRMLSTFLVTCITSSSVIMLWSQNDNTDLILAVCLHIMHVWFYCVCNAYMQVQRSICEIVYVLILHFTYWWFGVNWLSDKTSRVSWYICCVGFHLAPLHTQHWFCNGKSYTVLEFSFSNLDKSLLVVAINVYVWYIFIMHIIYQLTSVIVGWK